MNTMPFAPTQMSAVAKPHDRLREILDQMDIPSGRKDLTQAANVAWLGRNMAIRNSAHPLFPEALMLLWKSLNTETMAVPEKQ
jgi:hypothetical protein